MFKIADVPIDIIIVGSRFRRNMGDIQALSADIGSLGLINPITIDRQNRLLCGQRRLEACRMLGWETIPARAVDMPELLAEHSENEFRKGLEFDERVAIGRAVEAYLGDRQGQRTDLAKPQLPQNFAEVKTGMETRTIAAKAAGFGNTETYRQAKQVVDNGSDGLVDAVKSGDVSISAAATLSKLPHAEQDAVLIGGKEAVLERMRQTREPQMQSTGGAPTTSVPDHSPVSGTDPLSFSDADPQASVLPTHQASSPIKAGQQAILAGLTGNNEWYTPAKWIEMARSVMGSIDVDPASCATAQATVQASRWFDQEQDGIKHNWPGNVWLNPPYARGLIEEFIDKLMAQFKSGIATQAIVLVDNRTDTRWFHALCSVASAVAFTKGRVNFYNEAVDSSSPANGSVFAYLGARAEAFCREFSPDCLILFPQNDLSR